MRGGGGGGGGGGGEKYAHRLWVVAVPCGFGPQGTASIGRRPLFAPIVVVVVVDVELGRHLLPRWRYRISRFRPSFSYLYLFFFVVVVTEFLAAAAAIRPSDKRDTLSVALVGPARKWDARSGRRLRHRRTETRFPTRFPPPVFLRHTGTTEKKSLSISCFFFSFRPKWDTHHRTGTRRHRKRNPQNTKKKETHLTASAAKSSSIEH